MLAIINSMEASQQFVLKPNIRGPKKAVHFERGGKAYFAFTANNHWLLWYFRKPAFNDGLVDWDILRSTFASISESDRADPQLAEATLRITSEHMAREVLNFVHGLRYPKEW